MVDERTQREMNFCWFVVVVLHTY